jgi:DNA replication protein DnaC
MGVAPEKVATYILDGRVQPAVPVADVAKAMVQRLTEGRGALSMPVLVKGKAIGIPHRYTGATPEQVLKNYDGLMTAAKGYLEGKDAGWPGTILHGKLGRGKTSAAIEVMRLFEGAGVSSLFEVLYDMVGQVKSTWGKDIDERDAIKRFVTPALLVIDEVGVQFDTEAERNILYSIIVTRHNKCLPTIMTTNDDLDTTDGVADFSASVGTRIINRFDGYTINATAWGGNIRTQKLGF